MYCWPRKSLSIGPYGWRNQSYYMQVLQCTYQETLAIQTRETLERRMSTRGHFHSLSQAWIGEHLTPLALTSDCPTRNSLFLHIDPARDMGQEQ